MLDYSTECEVKDINRVDNSTYDNVEAPPKERGEFLKAIQILRSFEQDWDGNDTLPPHPQALDTAELFIQKLPWQRVFPDSVYPGSDRSIVFEWSHDADHRLILTIEPYYIGMVRILTNGKIDDLGDYELLPDSNILPKPLQDIIPRLT